MNLRRSITAIATAAAVSAAGVTGVNAGDRHFTSDQNFDGGYINTGLHRGSARTSVIDKRIANQKRRIRRGVRLGQLRRPHEKRLRAELSSIRSVQRLYMEDGHLTRFEKHNLRWLLKRNSRRIRRLVLKGAGNWRGDGRRGRLAHRRYEFDRDVGRSPRSENYAAKKQPRYRDDTIRETLPPYRRPLGRTPHSEPSYSKPLTRRYRAAPHYPKYDDRAELDRSRDYGSRDYGSKVRPHDETNDHDAEIDCGSKANIGDCVEPRTGGYRSYKDTPRNRRSRNERPHNEGPSNERLSRLNGFD